jgi:uncharacterized membrane protein
MQDVGVIMGTNSFGSVSDVSGDGSVLVGTGMPTSPNEAFRWDAVNGFQALGGLDPVYPDTYPFDVSADGTVVVGESERPDIWMQDEAFVWDPVNGLHQVVPSTFGSVATAVSADGTVVVGNREIEAGWRAFRWDPVNGSQDIAFFWARDVSADGSQIVGYSFNGADRAVLWDAINGEQDLGTLPGDTGSEATAISGYGNIVGGRSKSSWGTRAFIWDAGHGMRPLDKVLTHDFGVNLAGWKLEDVTAISHNGAVIVGNGVNPDGNPEAWRVDLLGLGFNKWVISGPDRNRDGMVDQEVEVGLAEPTEYTFRIRVNRPDLPQGMVSDTVPAEWEVVSCVPEHRDDPVAVYPQDRSANSATVIDWMPERNQGRLQVTIRTRPIPVEGGITQRSGKTPPGAQFYPHFPGKLMINYGATLLDEPDRPFFDSGNPLQTEALSVQAVERLDGSTGTRQ